MYNYSRYVLKSEKMTKHKFETIEIKNFKARYLEDLIPFFKKKYNTENIHSIPKLVKVVLNVRVGQAVIVGGSTTEKQKKPLDKLSENFGLIAGQKPITCLAKQSVSNFKLRAGDVNGLKVTLRGDVMFYFLEKLVYVALPRTRNFRGFSEKNIDKSNNFSITVKSSEVFPEGDIGTRFPIGVTMVFQNSKTKEQTVDLLRGFYIPI